MMQLTGSPELPGNPCQQRRASARDLVGIADRSALPGIVQKRPINSQNILTIFVLFV
ncbi:MULTISPECIES: hypothetical protein [Microcoleaceae]|uniref:hypothetical protein n=1 Tax=Microcoleaceae TaxID=1892252 RepID=UPI001882ED87|nr:hypothetical protein [Tychonema sp. LEGE 06208]MBE9164288.1 hypothetical protein [Tychonema sp. LEGE 06208]